LITAILRPHEAAVDHRPLDAMRTLLHRLLRQTHEYRLWQCAGRNIDFDFDGQSVDAQQREGVQLGEHGCRVAKNGCGTSRLSERTADETSQSANVSAAMLWAMGRGFV
jgi:hypothetical protein